MAEGPIRVLHLGKFFPPHPGGIERFVADLAAAQSAQGLAVRDLPKEDLAKVIGNLGAEMKQAAKDLEFEKAAMLRDQVLELRQQLLDIDDKTPEWEKARKMGDMAEDDFADLDGNGRANGNGKARNGTTAAKTSTEYVIKKPAKGKPGRARERGRK